MSSRRPSAAHAPGVRLRREPVDAFIGLGANLGDAGQSLTAALHALDALSGAMMVRQSSLYKTAPIDSSGPDYINAVAQLRTELGPFELMKKLRAIERAHGRRRPYRNAPRTLDLDLLLYGDLTIDTPELMLPHPRMHRRAFVLLPLIEIAPDIAIPSMGRMHELLASVADQGAVKIGA